MVQRVLVGMADLLSDYSEYRSQQVKSTMSGHSAAAGDEVTASSASASVPSGLNGSQPTALSSRSAVDGAVGMQYPGAAAETLDLTSDDKASLKRKAKPKRGPPAKSRKKDSDTVSASASLMDSTSTANGSGISTTEISSAITAAAASTASSGTATQATAAEDAELDAYPLGQFSSGRIAHYRMVCHL